MNKIKEIYGLKENRRFGATSVNQHEWASIPTQKQRDEETEPDDAMRVFPDRKVSKRGSCRPLNMGYIEVDTCILYRRK